MLPPDSGLSNCVYCFLKGGPTLRKVHREMETAKSGPPAVGYGTLEGTPCDVGWWRRMEAMYGRDLVAEERTVEADHDFVGFFGAGNRFSYGLLADADDAELVKFSGGLLPLRLHRLGVEQEPIYLDYQSTTPLDPRVTRALVGALEIFGNPHGRQHAFGRAAADAVGPRPAAGCRIAGNVPRPHRIYFGCDGVMQSGFAGSGTSSFAGTKTHRDSGD